MYHLGSNFEEKSKQKKKKKWECCFFLFFTLVIVDWSSSPLTGNLWPRHTGFGEADPTESSLLSGTVKQFKVTKPYFPISFFLYFFIFNRIMRDIVFITQFSRSAHVNRRACGFSCVLTQSCFVLLLYWGNRNGTGPACLHWSIKWSGGGQSSALLRPLFTLTFIELINKGAPGSGAVFTAPLIASGSRSLHTRLRFYPASLPTCGKKVPPDYFHWSKSVYKMELNLTAHQICNMIMCKLWS